MRAGMAGQGVSSQTLLLPEVVEIDDAGCDRLEARAEDLAELGLQLERFGPRATPVRGVQGPVGPSAVHGLTADPADELRVSVRLLRLTETPAHLAATVSCPRSVAPGRNSPP